MIHYKAPYASVPLHAMGSVCTLSSETDVYSSQGLGKHGTHSVSAIARSSRRLLEILVETK